MRANGAYSEYAKIANGTQGTKMKRMTKRGDFPRAAIISITAMIAMIQPTMGTTIMQASHQPGRPETFQGVRTQLNIGNQAIQRSELSVLTMIL